MNEKARLTPSKADSAKQTTFDKQNLKMQVKPNATPIRDAEDAYCLIEPF